jgi:hypothetical protein
MKDESWAAEFAARVELACQDLVLGMALGDGCERLRAKGQRLKRDAWCVKENGTYGLGPRAGA